jgi:hypothetical protein
MDDWGEDATRTPTAAWLAEQEAKQAAYAARRRAWARRLGRGASPEEDEVEETAGLPPASGTDAAGLAGRMTRRRAPRGPVHDPRQGRFAF